MNNIITIHQSGVLTALAWLVPHETAAVSAQVLCMPCSHASCDVGQNNYMFMVHQAVLGAVLYVFMVHQAVLGAVHNVFMVHQAVLGAVLYVFMVHQAVLGAVHNVFMVHQAVLGAVHYVCSWFIRLCWVLSIMCVHGSSGCVGCCP